MVLISRSALALLAFSGTILAAPTSQVDPFPNMVVLIRDSLNEGFYHSTKMADRIKSEIRSGLRTETGVFVAEKTSALVPKSAPAVDSSREVLDILEKRASRIYLKYCTDSLCTQNCQETFSEFSVNFCLHVPKTQCIYVMDLTNAKIKYWNNSGCNGNISSYTGCRTTKQLAAPGTNSIGFQTGCT